MSNGELKETAAPYRAEEFKSEFAPLIDALYRQEVLEARSMAAEQKLILGERLFRWACAITLEGIRNQNPGATEAECQRMLRERVDLGKKLGTL
jgi:hypothetical protein